MNARTDRRYPTDSFQIVKGKICKQALACYTTTAPLRLQVDQRREPHTASSISREVRDPQMHTWRYGALPTVTERNTDMFRACSGRGKPYFFNPSPLRNIRHYNTSTNTSNTVARPAFNTLDCLSRYETLGNSSDPRLIRLNIDSNPINPT
jgi:hypothetical protein